MRGGGRLHTVDPDVPATSSASLSTSLRLVPLSQEGEEGLRDGQPADPCTIWSPSAPTEIHVWLARWTGKPVYVMVTEPRQLWEVTGAAMRKVDKP